MPVVIKCQCIESGYCRIRLQGIAAAIGYGGKSQGEFSCFIGKLYAACGVNSNPDGFRQKAVYNGVVGVIYLIGA